MTWDQQPVDVTSPPAFNPTPPTPASPHPNGFRRAVLTAGMVAALLVTGGTAIVLAASPDPSASSAPSTQQPSTNGSNPSTNGQRHNGQPCPNMGTGGSSGSSGSSGGSSTPSTQTPSTTAPLT